MLQTKGKWKTAAAEAGRPKAEGVEAYDAANAQYLACHGALERLMGSIAGELLSRVAAAMDGLLDNWRSYKHAAALLDFDDLLYTARNLLAGREQVRQALADRFQHVLVDEFQDTDPLQIDILWRLCGEASEGRRRRSSGSGASSRGVVSGRRSQASDLSFPRRRRKRLYRRTHGHRRCRAIEDHRELPLGRADPQLR